MSARCPCCDYELGEIGAGAPCPECGLARREFGAFARGHATREVRRRRWLVVGMFSVCWVVLAVRFVAHNPSADWVSLLVGAVVIAISSLPAALVLTLVPGPRSSAVASVLTAVAFGCLSWAPVRVDVAADVLNFGRMAGGVVMAGVWAFVGAVVMLGVLQVGRKLLGMSIDDSVVDRR